MTKPSEPSKVLGPSASISCLNKDCLHELRLHSDALQCRLSSKGSFTQLLLAALVGRPIEGALPWPIQTASAVGASGSILACRGAFTSCFWGRRKMRSSAWSPPGSCNTVSPWPQSPKCDCGSPRRLHAKPAVAGAPRSPVNMRPQLVSGRHSWHICGGSRSCCHRNNSGGRHRRYCTPLPRQGGELQFSRPADGSGRARFALSQRSFEGLLRGIHCHMNSASSTDGLLDLVQASPSRVLIFGFVLYKGQDL